MGKLIVCVGKYAKKPYYLGRICYRIYSIEELCFYICENAFLLDKDIVQEKLVKWIDEALGLEELADTLYGLVRADCSVAVFVSAILEYTHYCSREKIAELEKMLKKQGIMNEEEKIKARADYFFRNQRYAHALSEYKKLLNELPEGKDDELKGKTYHNMGVIYAHMFSFEIARDCFYKAYELTHRQDSYQQYLTSCRFFMGEQEYIRFMSDQPEGYHASIEVEKRLEEGIKEWEESEIKQEIHRYAELQRSKDASLYYEYIDKTVARLREEYRSIAAR